MDKIPAGTTVKLNSLFEGIELKCTILAHVPEYDSALVIFPGDTESATVRRFESRFVKVVS